MEKMDALACIVGGSSDEILYSRSISLQIWLLGYELSDTLMVLTEKAIYFLASKKKIECLAQLQKNLDSEVPKIHLLPRDKADNDAKNFAKIANAIKESKEGQTLGVFSKDKVATSTFTEKWTECSKKFTPEDMSLPFAQFMAIKDDTEMNLVKKACQASTDVFWKGLRDKLLTIIDGNKKKTHEEFSEDLANLFEANKDGSIPGEKYVDKAIDASSLELCYPPIVMSGGKYKLKYSASSNNDKMHFGAIICSMGMRYKSYCSNITRTFLVNPSEKISSIYTLLLNAMDHLIGELKEGAKLSDVYKSTVNFVKKENPSLVDKLTKNFGSIIGIDFRESAFIISPNCDAIVKKGMVFNVNIGFDGLENKEASDAKGKNVALFLADTVLANEGEAATVLTLCKKKLSKIAIILQDEDDEEDDDAEKENSLPDPTSFGRGKRTAIVDNKLR